MIEEMIDAFFCSYYLFFLNTVIIDDSEMGGIRLEWLKVKDSEELKQLGTFNEVRRQIKLDGGKHIHITGRSWNELIEAISSFKQKLETLKVNEHPSVEVSKERVNDRVNNGDYFTSLASEYIFYLTELDGQLRMNKLNIKSTHFSDQRQAKSWRDKISKVIHPDLCHHQKASEAMAQLNDLYNQMVGRD